MKTILSWAARAFLLLFVLLIAITGYVIWHFNASLAKTSGEIEASDLAAPVHIVRDRQGVPHIFAKSYHDLYFAVGVVHAQDRMFQMDLSRRFSQGRLSELLGKTTIRSDAKMRTLGLKEGAESSFELYNSETRALYSAYADGINSVIGAKGYKAPPEYLLLQQKPEAWQPVDAVSVFKTIAYGLSGDAFGEPAKKKLVSILGEKKARELLAPYPEYAPVALSPDDLGYSSSDTAEDKEETSALPAAMGAPPKGSNNWVVSGELTASGKPILANDPHLLLSAPGVWYFMRMQVEDEMVLGGTMPGSPFVILGRNHRMAWGFTNTGPDVADLFVEPIKEIVTNEHNIEIKVKGAKNISLTVLRTERGPVLDKKWFKAAEMANPDQMVIWQGTLDDGDDLTGQIGLPSYGQHSFEDFKNTMRNFQMPQQNMVFANDEGHIGFIAAARVPIRDEEGKWTGSIPFDELPSSYNTKRHYYATANNKIVPDEYPHYITNSWYGFHRSQRIVDMLETTDLHDKRSFAKMQMDEVSTLAVRALPLLRRSTPATIDGKKIQKILALWDGDLSADGTEGLLYTLWMREFARLVYEDDLGDDFESYWSERRQFIDGVIEGRYAHWCNDITTVATESCLELASIALDQAASVALSHYGKSYENIKWGDVHEAVFAHPAFGKTPLARFFNVRVPVGGDTSTVNVAHTSIKSEKLDVNWGPSFRAIYDFADINSSRFMHGPGQSGHFLSPHYRDLAPRWAKGEYFEIRSDWTEESPPPGSQTLLLHPKEQ